MTGIASSDGERSPFCYRNSSCFFRRFFSAISALLIFASSRAFLSRSLFFSFFVYFVAKGPQVMTATLLNNSDSVFVNNIAIMEPIIITGIVSLHSCVLLVNESMLFSLLSQCKRFFAINSRVILSLSRKCPEKVDMCVHRDVL